MEQKMWLSDHKPYLLGVDVSFRFKWRENYGGGQVVCIVKQFWSSCGPLDQYLSSRPALFSEDVFIA